MRYTINITQESDLEETWIDPNVPNMAFCFNEISLDECADLGNGTYEASYESFDVTEVSVFNYIDDAGLAQEYTLQPGEYGVRINSRRG